MKMLLKRARIIDPSQNVDRTGDILISDGKICEIGEDLFSRGAEAEEILDCNGLIAAPGLVDLHVHLRDPGQTQKEDVFSGCRAAAAGGVTSLLAMPNTAPPMDSPERVEALLCKAKEADAAVYTAACITEGLRGERPTDLAALRKAGAIALSDDGRPVKNTACLLEALKRAPELGMIVTAHCEDQYLAEGGLLNEGEVSRFLGVKGIPNAAEDCGTARELAAAASVDAPIHICHVSTRGSVALIREAKARGVRVTAETCPHYLLLTEEALRKRDADYRMNPPLRSEADRQALLEGLKDGTIDAIATDHAPHTEEEKARPLTQAPSGMIGLETSLAATLTALYHTGEMNLSDILRKMTVNPACILRLPGKGRLAVGSDADLVLFDPNEEWVVDPTVFRSKARNTPFAGKVLKGRVKCTISGGKIIYQDK